MSILRAQACMNGKRRGRTVWRALLVGTLGFFVVVCAFAESPSVTAVLSNSEAAVGKTVQLQIRVTGGRSADAPEKIAVDGLQIYRTGTSQHFEMNNFNVTSSVIYDYAIVPMKAGTFKIPPQTIRLGSNALHTPALTLNVTDSPGRSSSSRSNREAQPENANHLVFAELVLPKKVAFVGEMVPAEIRLGIDPHARPELTDAPEIAGQGFTTQKLQQSQHNLETINGKSYDVVTFKTAIAATRTGKFEIGPVKAKARVSVPRRQATPRSRSPFDLFNLDDPLSDPFFADPLGRLAERRVVEMESEPATFEVKPLPPNAPPNSSGGGGDGIATGAGGDSGRKRETVAEAAGHFISTHRAAESGAIVHAPLFAAAFLDRAARSAACAPRVNWLESDTSAPRESRGAAHRGVAARGGGIDAEAAPQRFLAAGIFLAGIARRPSENGPRAQYRSKRSGCGNRGGGVRSR